MAAILITGASSGIGAALADIYACPENILFLCGRNKERLDLIAEKCRAKNSLVYTQIIDVCDEEKMAQWIIESDEKNNLDLVIANAGISAGTASSSGLENKEQIAKIFSTNLFGVINTINPIISRMKSRKNGQIAIISSLAGFRGIPGCPSYSASKAAVKIYGESLRPMLTKYNVKINVVTPGYITTPMTDVNDFYMPFKISAEKAAIIIKKNLEKNKSRIAFPFPLYFIVWFSSILPTKITDFIFGFLPEKKSLPKS